MARRRSPFDPPPIKRLSLSKLVPVLRANARALRKQAATRNNDPALRHLAAREDARADEIERTGEDPLGTP